MPKEKKLFKIPRSDEEQTAEQLQEALEYEEALKKLDEQREKKNLQQRLKRKAQKEAMKMEKENGDADDSDSVPADCPLAKEMIWHKAEELDETAAGTVMEALEISARNAKARKEKKPLRGRQIGCSSSSRQQQQW